MDHRWVYGRQEINAQDKRRLGKEHVGHQFMDSLDFFPSEKTLCFLRKLFQHM
jgi:hypothetical protein